MEGATRLLPSQSVCDYASAISIVRRIRGARPFSRAHHRHQKVVNLPTQARSLYGREDRQRPPHPNPKSQIQNLKSSGRRTSTGFTLPASRDSFTISFTAPVKDAPQVLEPP
jgi:hypothetical protein